MVDEKKFYAYVLECGDGTFYCGYTNNIKKRAAAHNSGKGAKYTRFRLPVKMVYFEEFQDKSEAMKREAALKKLSHNQKGELKNIFLKRGINMVQVVGALFVKDGKFMICKRPQNKARGGLWEFVGGKVEADETLEDALKRECMEEMGIEISVGELFYELVHAYEDITINFTVFKAEITKGEPQKLEHEDIRWISPNEIDEYDFCPADVDILKKIKEEM